jgi:hypothetical protein
VTIREAPERAGGRPRNPKLDRAILDAVLELLSEEGYERMSIESVAQRAALGRQVRRDVQDFTGSWGKTLRLHGEALDEAARGLTNTPTQRRFTRAMDELLGKYEGYPPWLRRIIQGPMPFLPWALNAARFIYWTMPAHRTAQTALLLKVNETVAKDWQAEHAGTPPGSLRLAIPTRTAAGSILRGTRRGDSRPRATCPRPCSSRSRLRCAGRPRRCSAAIRSEGNCSSTHPRTLARRSQQPPRRAASRCTRSRRRSSPGRSTARRLREGGGTAYAGSTVVGPDVKPGTRSMSAARRTFDPFRPTYLGAPARPSPTAGVPAGHEDRVSAALDRIAAEDDARSAQEARIDAALDAIGIP